MRPTARRQNLVQGFIERTGTGINVEFRLPLELLGSQALLRIDLRRRRRPADADASCQLTQTLPSAGKESFNLVVLRSREVLNIIQGLGYSGARILVVDAQRRVRAETGHRRGSAVNRPSAPPGSAKHASCAAMISPYFHEWIGEGPPGIPSSRWTNARPDAAISAALEGRPDTNGRRLVAAKTRKCIDGRASDRVQDDRVIGTVVVEQNHRPDSQLPALRARAGDPAVHRGAVRSVHRLVGLRRAAWPGAFATCAAKRARPSTSTAACVSQRACAAK